MGFWVGWGVVLSCYFAIFRTPEGHLKEESLDSLCNSIRKGGRSARLALCYPDTL